MPKETPVSELAPQDVGIVTIEQTTKYADIAELLARHNQLADRYVAMDDKLQEKTLAHVLTQDQELAHAIQKELSEIGEALKRLFQTINVSPVEKQAFHDLNLLAVLKAANNPFQGTEDALFFSQQDIEKVLAVRSDTQTSHWLPQRLRLKMDVKELVGRAGPHAAFKKKVEDQQKLAVHHEKREAARIKLAEKLKRNISVGNLLREEARLAQLGTVVELIVTAAHVLKDTETTTLQKIRAQRSLNVGKEFLSAKFDERSPESVTMAEQSLRHALDLPRLATQARTRVERMTLDLLEQMETARVKVRGIGHLFETLPVASRPDAEKIHAAHAKLIQAGQDTEEAFRAVKITTDHVLQALDQGLQAPEKVEGLVSTIENGNLRELYTISFDEAMAKLTQAIVELSSLLKLAPSKKLEARHEVRGLRSDAARERAELTSGEFILQGLQETQDKFPSGRDGKLMLPDPESAWKKQPNDPGYKFDWVWTDTNNIQNGYNENRPLSDFGLTKKHLDAIDMRDQAEQARLMAQAEIRETEPIGKIFDITEAIQKKRDRENNQGINTLTTKEVFEAIDEAGYRPATLVEILAYAKYNWKPEPEDPNQPLSAEEKQERCNAPYIYALSSPFSSADGSRSVPYLGWYGSERGLGASVFVRGWGSGDRFLVFRK